MNQPKFQIGQKVKFANDHDRMVGEVLEFSYHSANIADDHSGYIYKVSSRYYDAEAHEMAEGHIMCREEELVDMTDYSGTVEQPKPTVTMHVEDVITNEVAPVSEPAQEPVQPEVTQA